MTAREHHVAIRKTARYHTLGEADAAVRQVWFVLHGHGQLAGYFLRDFTRLADGTRLIVAPEALNRFYLEPAHWKSAGEARVGATWMTREDRLAEIDDYVAYLDTLHDQVFATLDRAAVRVVVLGFSQGVATAFRWACGGRVRADAFVAWAGAIPPELDREALAPLERARVIRVLGDRDEIATPEAVATENERAARLGLTAELVRFGGGHELNADVLLGLGI
jgi:predicted esterase